ncbi:MAG: acyl-CoA thioesterase [Planctomycetes bacterium]|nr:acyl-CoA thioesterase [Planctomycetota bacterium]
MFFRFAADVPLRWVDVDSAGVVNNAVYLSLCEQARLLYFQHLGLLQDHRVPYVLAEANVKFLRPGRLGGKVEVAVRVRSLGTTSFHTDYEVRSGDEVLVTSTAVLVHVDANFKPSPLPDEWRQTIAQFEELPA